MTDHQDGWKQVASKAEALGLKLKLHMEQEQEEEAGAEDATAGEGSTRATLEDFGQKLQDVFDSLGSAAKDPAVRADFKEMGTLVKDAISDTFSSVSSDVGDAMKKARRSGDTDSSAGDPATDGDPSSEV